MKWVVGILLVIFILICGCSSTQETVVETNSTIITPTPVAVTVTWIQTVGPTPTLTNDVRECYNRSLQEYPEFCYDVLYWVRPTYSPPGSVYTAKIWKTDWCVNLNKTSGLCEGWGNDLYTAIFMHNRTIVRNLSGIELPEVISAASYYNRTFDLNVINGESFDSFILKYWDGTYPGVKYNTSNFEPDPNAVIYPVDTFNPDAW